LAPRYRPSDEAAWVRLSSTGSLVLTGKRLSAFAFSRTIVDVPLDDDRINELRFSLEGEATLCVHFDPSAFHEDWSGTLEVRFSTPRARLFLEWLDKYGAS